MAELFMEAVVEELAKFIADELHKVLACKYNSYIQDRISKDCRADQSRRDVARSQHPEPLVRKGRPQHSPTYQADRSDRPIDRCHHPVRRQIIEPAAGSFIVMKAVHHLGRNFIGCDLNYRGTNQ
jgi:hypothetical protein